MSLESIAGSIGGELLQSAVKKDGMIREFAESMGQKVLDKLGNKFGGSFDRHLDRALDKRREAATPSASHAHIPDPAALTRVMALGPVDSAQAATGLQSFDANADGQISREELKQGLDDLSHQMANDQTHADGSAEATQKRKDAAQLYQMGQEMLTHYNDVAALGGNGQSLDVEDVNALARGDKTISFADWKNVLG